MKLDSKRVLNIIDSRIEIIETELDGCKMQILRDIFHARLEALNQIKTQILNDMVDEVYHDGSPTQ